MGTWDAGSFGNDTAVDWSWGLEQGGLEHLESALDALLTAKEPDATVGEEAVAAAEVVARLLGKPGTEDSYSESADNWVKLHGKPPSPALIQKAIAAIDRVSQAPSELLTLWQESGEHEWIGELQDLNRRLGRRVPAT